MVLKVTVHILSVGTYIHDRGQLAIRDVVWQLLLQDVVGFSGRVFICGLCQGGACECIKFELKKMLVGLP